MGPKLRPIIFYGVLISFEWLVFPLDALAQEMPKAATPEAIPGESVVLPDRVALVGDKVITGAEFKRGLEFRWRSLEVEQGVHIEPDPRFRLEVLEQLINGRVLDMLAEGAEIKVSEEEVEEDYAAGKASMPSEEAYAAYMSQRGFTREYLIGEIRNRIVKYKYRASMRIGLTVTEEALQDAYAALKASGQAYRSRRSADVGHIMIRATAGDSASEGSALARIEGARVRILAGASFSDVAREVSEDTGSARRGGLYVDSMSGAVPEIIESSMFEVPLEEVSEPIRSAIGWHLIIVYERYNPGLYTFEALRVQLRASLIDRQVQTLLEEKVSGMRNILRIEIDDEAVASIPLTETE